MFEVYSTKPGDAAAAGWRWALTKRGDGLSRSQADTLSRQIRSEGFKAVVYAFGTLRYSDIGQTVRA